ncbi:hypothetical protein QZN10_06970, partial [Burkholderia contaminans]|nr:hypothetical protein [Burkholderia contaminans]
AGCIYHWKQSKRVIIMENQQVSSDMETTKRTEIATLAGGCFWSSEIADTSGQIEVAQLGDI